MKFRQTGSILLFVLVGIFSCIPVQTQDAIGNDGTLASSNKTETEDPIYEDDATNYADDDDELSATEGADQMTFNRSFVSDDPGRCVMYGVCDESFQLPCKVNHKPKKVSPAIMNLLNGVCPELVAKYGDHLCCDETQIASLVGNLAAPVSLMSRCPSCAYNFRQSFCDFTCSPYQYKFMNVSIFEESPEDPDVPDKPKEMVKEIECFISKQYVHGTYDSCKNVLMSSTNGPVMDFMCGELGAYHCTAQRWFDYLGSTSNGYAPFEIKYMYIDENRNGTLKKKDGETIEPLNFDVSLCSQVAPGSYKACSCVDCPMSCPLAPPLMPLAEEWKILGINGMVVVMSLIFVLGAASILFFAFMKYTAEPNSYSMGSEQADSWQDEKPGRFQRMGLRSEHSINYFFTRLAESFSAGIYFLEVTTDPVELWASPHSTSRMQKEYFDQKFSPFYRIEHLIITAKNLPNVTHHTATGLEEFGPIFNKDFMYAILDLQERIQEIVSEKNNVSLSDICFKPLAPENNNCTVFSYLGWWQDSTKEIEREAENPRGRKDNYLDHFKFCARNPVSPKDSTQLHQSCLGLYGGPVDPSVVLGGFLKDGETMSHEPPYQNANTAIITFVVSNHYKKEDRKNAEEWEEAFLKFMNDYTSGNKTPKFFEVAYSAERSIQDELKRESEGEITIVVISYKIFVMSLSKLQVINRTLVPNYPDSKTYYRSGGCPNQENSIRSQVEKAISDGENFPFNVKLKRGKGSSEVVKTFTITKDDGGIIRCEDENQNSKRLCNNLIMFLYISVNLGQITSFSRILIDSQISLGIAGVVIVLVSVSSSVGIFGYIGVPATLIIIEVIPFLVLAVGVDNIFIMVQHYQRDARLPEETKAQQLGRVVGEVAPSMLLNSFTDSASFFLGVLSTMPAVRAFSLYAGVALLFNFALQFTCFIAFFSLDIARREHGRVDVLCCIKGKQLKNQKIDKGVLYAGFKKIWAPMLMKFHVRVGVIVVFFFWLCSSCAVLPKIDVGLDQQIAMPEDSYVNKYFGAMFKYLSVGPPVYFVVEDTGFNYSNDHDQDLIRAGEFPSSLVSQVFAASKISNRTYIAKPPSSWLDDYMDWAGNENCCKYRVNVSDFCPSSTLNSRICKPCELHRDLQDGRLPPELFEKYLTWFLRDNPSETCPKGGHAAYGQAVVTESINSSSSIARTSYFMTYHNILKTSQDYTEAMKEARIIAANITFTLNQETNSTRHKVFPYSVFYVFYEQYLTMWRDTLQSLGISFVTVFILTFLLTGFDAYSAFVIMLTIFMMVTNIGGLMYYWGISLNAVSLVNLVMSIGIAVEFCTHIVHAFTMSKQISRVERARESLVNMGSSVQKLLDVVVIQISSRNFRLVS